MAHNSLLSGKSKGAFTLIEILVVLVIMGFLVSMVAPKLAGIVDGAVDTTCDTNQERLRTVLNVYVNENRSLPGGLANIVKYHTNFTTPANVAIPLGDDSDKASKETLSWELVERMKPKVHFLDEDEALELVQMGVKNVNILAKVADATALALTAGDGEEDNIVEQNVRMPIAAGRPVFMIGVGDSDNDGAFAEAEYATGNTISVDADSVVTETNTTASIYTTAAANANGVVADFVRFDEGKNIGRIVFGVSNMGDLVQGGYLEESGTCPGQLLRADHHTWGNYLIIMPRLEATFNKMTASNATATEGDIKLHAIALDAETGASASGAKIIGRTQATGQGKFGAQELSMFTTTCPEGHVWGSNAEAFAIKLSNE